MIFEADPLLVAWLVPADAPAIDLASFREADGLDEMVKRFADRILVRRRGAFVLAAEARAAFEAFAESQNCEPANPTAFGKAMTKLGFERAKIGGVMRYEGVALTVPATPASLRVAVDNTGERRALGRMVTAGRAQASDLVLCRWCAVE